MLTLLEVVQLAYRKHVLCDDRIGWDELDEILGDALSNGMGPCGFIEWANQIEKEMEEGKV